MTNEVSCVEVNNILHSLNNERGYYPSVDRLIYAPGSKIKLAAAEYEAIKSHRLVEVVEIGEEYAKKLDWARSIYQGAQETNYRVHQNLQRTEAKLLPWGKKQAKEDVKISDAELVKAKIALQEIEIPGIASYKELDVESLPGKFYAKINDRGREMMREINWINISFGSLPFGTAEYRERAKTMAERDIRDYTTEFGGLLARLNSLSDDTARTVEERFGFNDIAYYGYDQKGGGFTICGRIRYVRNFDGTDLRMYNKVAVPDNYTGFIFDDNKHPDTEYPELKTVAATPEELGKIIIKHKRRDELNPFFEPTPEKFFFKAYDFKMKKHVLAKDIDKAAAEEILEKFPELKT